METQTPDMMNISEAARRLNRPRSWVRGAVAGAGIKLTLVGVNLTMTSKDFAKLERESKKTERGVSRPRLTIRGTHRENRRNPVMFFYVNALGAAVKGTRLDVRVSTGVANIGSVSPKKLGTRAPFSDLFPIAPTMLATIKESMVDRGFDVSKPINVWQGENIIVDGHTRQRAAIQAGVDVVPVCYHEFESEDEALSYAINNQRNRRNVTDADLMRFIEMVDKRKSHGAEPGGRGNQWAGGNCSTEQLPENTAETTAKVVGTSVTKVVAARTIIDAAEKDPAVKQDVLDGKKSIRGAAQEVRDKKRKEAKPYTPVVVPPTAEAFPLSYSSVAVKSEADEAYLAQFPLRSRVVASRFDDDALVYREFSTEFSAMSTRVKRLVGQRSSSGQSVLCAAILKMSPLPPINTWSFCESCKGTGNGCRKCRGGGYTIPGL